MDLNTIWFVLLVVLIVGYAILDGFDLGVGTLHFLAKSDKEKRININSIAPVWDGNEVWLLTAGGALFAAFPVVYSTVFSGFYLAFMLLLLALIFRAVSMELRGKVDSEKWRKRWDLAFNLGSVVPLLLYGVAIGNILRGLPLDVDFYYTGTFFQLLNIPSLVAGLLSVALFTMHGALYSLNKTEGEFHERVKSVVLKLWTAFLLFFVIFNLINIMQESSIIVRASSNPVSYLFLLLTLISVAMIPLMFKKGNYKNAFFYSSTLIFALVGLIAIGLFPMLVPNLNDISKSIDIYNGSSTKESLKTMFYIALIGMPVVIGYTIFIYRIFKGKTQLDEHSY